MQQQNKNSIKLTIFFSIFSITKQYEIYDHID